jgi:hypothetical protein
MKDPILSREEVFKLAQRFEGTEDNDNIPEVVALTPIELESFIFAVLERVCGEPAAEVVREHFAGRVVWDFKVFDRAMKHGTKLYTLKDRQS